MSTIYYAAQEFFDLVKNNPVTHPNGLPYNVYSYGYIDTATNPVTVEGKNPAYVADPTDNSSSANASSDTDKFATTSIASMQTLAEAFPLPSGSISWMKLTNGLAPYIGVSITENADGSTTRQGVSITDCSGFVGFIIIQINHLALQEISIGAKMSSVGMPLAGEYANFFQRIHNSKHWTNPCTDGFDASKAIPGDILAWSIDPNGPNNTTHDSGHVMIVTSLITIPASQSKTGKDIYHVQVIDSNGLIHINDDRPAALINNSHKGLGQGAIAITNDNGWQVSFNPQFKADKFFTPEHIALLRLNES